MWLKSQQEGRLMAWGKKLWDGTIRLITYHVFDVFIVHVKDQHPSHMVDLRQQMDAQYEYVNKQLSIKGFEDSVSRFLKGEQSPLKHLFTKKKRPTDLSYGHGT